MHRTQSGILKRAILSALLVLATTQTEAADLDTSAVKTIHIKLHGNDVSWLPNDSPIVQMMIAGYGCASLPFPPPPAPITLFKNPGNVIRFIDTETDIYWSGTHLARYSTSTEYTLKKSDCIWEKKPIVRGEVVDYKTRSSFTIDFVHQVVHKARGLYKEPNPALRLKEDAAYPGMVKGSDSAAGYRCDVVVDPMMKGFPIVEYNACVLSGMHRFPDTNNRIELKTRTVLDTGAGKGMRVQEASEFEINVPIPEDKFRLPPGFPVR